MRFLFPVLLFLVFLTPYSSGQQENKGLQSNPADDLFDLAQLAYQEAIDTKDGKRKKANYESALRQFTRFLQHHDNHPHALEAWYYSASCYNALGQKEAALRCRRTVVARWQTGQLVGLAALQLANHHFELKEYEESARNFDLAIAQVDHLNAKRLACYRRALCYQKLGKTKETISALEVVLADEESPYHLRAQKALAHYYRNGDQKEKAYALFRILAQSDERETSAEATLQSALLARDLGKEKETLQHFEEILGSPDLKKWHGEAQLFLMSEAAKKKDYARVLALFKGKRPSLKKEHQAKRLLLAIQAYEQTGEGETTTALYRELETVAPNAQTSLEASYIVLSRLYPQGKAPEFTDQARKFLNSYEKSHPKDRRLDNVRLMLAETEYARKQFTQAAALYAAITLTNLDTKNHPEVRFRLASALRQAGREQEASAALSTFLKHHPTDPRGANALAKRGEAAQDRKDFPAALQDYDHLLTLTKDPQLIEYAWAQKAEVFKAQGNLPALISAQELLIKKFPDRTKTANGASWFWIGWAQFRLEKFADCLAPFTSARALDAKSFGKEASVHLALAHYSLQQSAELKKEVDALHKDHSKTILPRPLYAWLGVTLTAANRAEEAWHYLPLAIDKKSPDETKTTVWLSYARSAFETKHFKEALRAYEILLAREESQFRKADYHYRLAQASFQLADHERSRAEAEAALELKPQGGLNGEIRCLLGDLASKEDDPATALQHYVVVVELYNEDQAALQRALAAAIKILEKNGNPDDLAQAQRYRKLLKSP